ncbi:rubrerythrin [Clostridium cylindrosporum]|uniref:Rubrerythrin-1 n=1 Tax=Clostridium cylindrosporum DSM 605 TaxID=1121307 RepID=A0A0J8DC43_CLOCY|nr:rubrerythrin family protein [Clostridium cylindrosporum]KMT21874.1 rubrerythrin-1 [Clostridium cylindrosporum DSM 605]
MKSLKGTKTAENLMKSFAGESQARNRYTFFAKAAKKDGYIEASNLFNEVADQESQHAKTFFRYLSRDLNGECLTIEATFPVSLNNSTVENLKSAAYGENEEWTDLYPEFAKVAREEGFEDVATSFENILVAERFHEARFNHILKNLEANTLFKKSRFVDWKCNNCGYVHTGDSAPEVCPACDHPQGYFQVFTL